MRTGDFFLVRGSCAILVWVFLVSGNSALGDDVRVLSRRHGTTEHGTAETGIVSTFRQRGAEVTNGALQLGSLAAIVFSPSPASTVSQAPARIFPWYRCVR